MERKQPFNRLSESSSDDGSGHQSPKHSKKSVAIGTENWMPREVAQVLELNVEESSSPVPEDIEIVHVGRNSRELKAELDLSKIVGLTVIEDFHKRARMPVAVCLTARKKIYVFQPSIQSHATFLGHTLRRKDIKFFTSNGPWDADLLSRHMKIDLQHSVNHYDLATFDIHLTITKHILEEKKPIDNYSITYVHNQIKPKEYSFQELVKKWLGLELDLRCTEGEINSIRRDPDNALAKNALKKRAGLVRAVAKKMVDNFEELKDQPTKNMFTFGVSAPDDIMEDYKRGGDGTYSSLINHLSQCPATKM